MLRGFKGTLSSVGLFEWFLKHCPGGSKTGSEVLSSEGPLGEPTPQSPGPGRSSPATVHPVEKI